MTAEIRYRADIDGLRAIAVLPVVFFHYHVSPFSGGFVGVDVFFVISGFLITSLIDTEISANRFSLAQFYDRRIRRIFPALMFVLAASVVAAVLILFPSDLKRFGDSLQAAVVFGSNFLFKNTTGYWDVAAQRKPLLHTWSLAVEEQYYLLFPAVLYLTAKRTDFFRLAIISAILVVSLGLSIWGVRHAPYSAFYLLPYRAWELMLGGIIAICGTKAPERRWLREVLTVLGLACIACSVFLYSAETRFPGAAALLPCGGAALIIFAGSGPSLVSTLLSSLPFRAVGLISYSLYLWHWVILVFAKCYLLRDLNGVETALAILASLAIAAFSWRLVEAPFRDRRNFTRKQIFAMGGAASAAIFAAGFLFAHTEGLPQRYSSDIRSILAVNQKGDIPKQDGCIGNIKRFDVQSTECRFGSRSSDRPSFALWGDSHAGMIQPILAEAAMRKHVSGYFAEHFSCPPTLGVSSNRSKGCREFNQAVLRAIVGDPGIVRVILMADWAKSAVGTPYGNDDSGDVLLRDDESRSVSVGENKLVFARGMGRLIGKLIAAGKKVTVVASTPETGWSTPEALAHEQLLGGRVDLRPSLKDYLARQQPVLQVLGDLHRRYGISVVYPHKILCGSGRCLLMLNGTSIYRDEHHLTYRGVGLLRPVLDPLVNP